MPPPRSRMRGGAASDASGAPPPLRRARACPPHLLAQHPLHRGLLCGRWTPPAEAMPGLRGVPPPLRRHDYMRACAEHTRAIKPWAARASALGGAGCELDGAFHTRMRPARCVGRWAGLAGSAGQREQACTGEKRGASPARPPARRQRTQRGEHHTRCPCSCCCWRPCSCTSARPPRPPCPPRQPGRCWYWWWRWAPRPPRPRCGCCCCCMTTGSCGLTVKVNRSLASSTESATGWGGGWGGGAGQRADRQSRRRAGGDRASHTLHSTRTSAKRVARLCHQAPQLLVVQVGACRLGRDAALHLAPLRGGWAVVPAWAKGCVWGGGQEAAVGRGTHGCMRRRCARSKPPAAKHKHTWR